MTKQNETVAEPGDAQRRDTFTFEITDASLAFRAIALTDPVPLGRQVLTAAGVNEVDEYSLFAILPNGDFEDIRLDEPFDLRAAGVEQFIYFKTDRSYRFKIESRQLYWGNESIPGVTLIALANLKEDESLYLEIRGGTDQLVEPDVVYDLSDDGVERFVVGPNPNASYEIFINSRPTTVIGRDVTYEQIVELAFPGANDPNIRYSMTYRKAASVPHAGELAEGGHVLVKKGTIFNVSATFKS